MAGQTSTIAASLETEGYAVIERLLDDSTVDALVAVVERAQAAAGSPSLRNVLADHPDIRGVLREPTVDAVLREVVGACWFVVRAILFDKVPGANWYVGWHQDQCIAVAERVATPGYGPWSVKDGVVHVEPPIEILEGMATLRIHLDDCLDDNGPLQVVLGSHRGGWLRAEAIKAAREERGVVACTTPRGGAVLMKPLTLHASRPATTPAHRRVLHLECAAAELPPPLRWHDRWR